MRYSSVLKNSSRILASLLLFNLLAVSGVSGQPNPVELRIGLRTKQSEARLQGTVPLQVRQDDTVVLDYPAEQALVFRMKDGTITVSDAADKVLLTADKALQVKPNPTPAKADGEAATPPPPPLIRLLGPAKHYDGKTDRPYRGYFTILPQKDVLTIINIIDVESYLWGVVSSEMGAGYPPEALKAQAIAARTYALKNRGRLAHEGFDLDDTARCQVYGGYFCEDPRTTAAVDATAGLVLIHKGTLIDAVYSSTCGGVTESAESAWGKSVSYLTSVSDNPADGKPMTLPTSEQECADYFKLSRAFNCLQPKYAKPEAFRWVKLVTRKELEAGFSETNRVGTLQKIVPLKRGTSGRILSLRLEGSDRAVVINSEGSIRSALGSLRSSAFTVDSYPDDQGIPVVFAFWGAGWGHGIGMCQVGAVGLALQGWTYDKILTHYYQGTTIEKR